jgi:hypothetical protein
LAAHLVGLFLPEETVVEPPAAASVPSPEPPPIGLDHLSDEGLAEKLLAGLRTLHDTLQ